LEVELEAVDPPDIEEWIEPGLGGTLAGLNFFGSGKGGGVTPPPPPTDFFPVLIVLTLPPVVFTLPALLATELTEAPDILLVRSLTGEMRLSPARLGVVRILIVEVADVRRARVGV